MFVFVCTAKGHTGGQAWPSAAEKMPALERSWEEDRRKRRGAGPNLKGLEKFKVLLRKRGQTQGAAHAKSQKGS